MPDRTTPANTDLGRIRCRPILRLSTPAPRNPR